MNNLWAVVGLALLPALGNFAGGLLAEYSMTPLKRLNRALHAAAGVVFAVIAVELMPEALAVISGWEVGVAFGLGGLAYIALQAGVGKIQDIRGNPGAAHLGMWMIYIAVAVDLFTDGLLIGTGSAVSLSMAVVLAAGQVLADIPEGYATIANMKDKGVPRPKRMLLSALFVVPVVGAAIFAFYLLRGQSESLKMAGLAFTAGLLAVAVIEDMITEAHEAIEDSRWSILAFTGGFVLFTFVSEGLGG